MNIQATLTKYGIGITDLPQNLQAATANLFNIIEQWTEMPDNQDKRLIRDMILKSDDTINELIKKLYNEKYFEMSSFARLTMLEAKYLTTNH